MAICWMLFQEIRNSSVARPMDLNDIETSIEKMVAETVVSLIVPLSLQNLSVYALKLINIPTQLEFTCAKLKMKLSEQCEKSIQGNNKDTITTFIGVVMVSLLSTMNRFRTLFFCFHF